MNVPKLRFKGFKDSWRTKNLSNIVTEMRLGGNYENSESNQGLPVIKMGNLGRGNIKLDKIQCIPLEEKYSKNDILKDGDFLFNTRNTLDLVGKSSIWRDELPVALFNSNLMKITFNTEIENSNRFINAFFNTKITIKQLRRFATGTTSVAAIYSKDLNSLKINYPSLPEQEKIASFFTVIDQKLNLLKEKKEKLELYKKGVMQQIFSQKLRFKDEKGNEFPEWEKIVLGNILTEVVEKSKVSNQEEVLSSTAKGLFKQSEYFNREIASSDSTGYKILRKFQLVFSPQNLWLGNINVNLKYEIGIVSPSYKIYKFNSNTTPQYGSFILKLPRMINEYKISSTQGASVVRRNLDMEAFENIPLHLPTLPEQQKIADFLSALDTKINLVSTQIEKTELWKKGLLQQMFV